jgi:GH24 family phage-related lysozyme (muramidase)
MTVLERAAAFIAPFEGYSQRPYDDSNGYATAGYGHLIAERSVASLSASTVRKYTLSEPDARALLARDLAKDYAPAVNALPVKLNDDQKVALISAVYNLGTGVLGVKHDLGRHLHAGELRAAADSLLEYDKDAKGQVLAGLQRRRKAERKLFLKTKAPRKKPAAPRPKAYKPSKAEVEHLQRAINRFLKKRGVPLAPLIVDGSYGPLTERYVVSARFFLGYVDEYRHRRPDQGFLDALAKPRSLGAKAWTRGLGRRRAARARHAASTLKSHLVTGVTTFDGVRVAKVAVPILQWCRENGWKGQLISGYRTPAYSEHLCIVMCGAPTCPGRCAGRGTNHAYAKPERFAADVSDYETFGRVVAECPLKPHIFNDLPNDPVHFSPTGS